MGRHTGPTERLSRREGVELELKGAGRLAGKAGLERRRDTPPGQHGHARPRRVSVYGRQLREKQRLKRYYSVRERLYRLGLASTQAQARQFVGHGHVLVNGRRVDIPSYTVSPGDVIELRMDSGARPAARAAADQLVRVAPWLMADPDPLRGTILRLPRREEIQVPVDEQLIVELYTRVLS